MLRSITTVLINKPLVNVRIFTIEQPKSSALFLFNMSQRNKSVKAADGDSITEIRHPSSVNDKQTDVHFGYGERKPIDEAKFQEFKKAIEAKQKEYAPSLERYNFDERRTRCINGIAAQYQGGNYRGVSFWMFRDQRIEDNWALIQAQKFALHHKCPLYVTFFLMSHYSVAGIRQYDFLLRGLQQVEKQCQQLGIQFHLRLGYGKDLIVEYCEENKIDLVIADFCPLRDPTSWVRAAGRKLRKKEIPLYQTDAHNIIPTWELKDRMAFGARSLRPTVFDKLPQYLTEIPALEKHPYQPEIKSEPNDWHKAWAHLKVDESVRPITWAKPGTINGYRMLYEFITQRLERYKEDRNTPTKHAQSYLSPYFHFGQLSVHRAILAVADPILKSKYAESVEQFVEEAVVRRELADNYCFFEHNYDNINGAFDWARDTIEDHRADKREYIYTQEQLQFAKTHDKLWNAAQNQMLREGTMHQYMRMYWAKKILEWTPSVEEAIRIALLFNDKYQMDGRDPNGYVGVMWAIAGVHDGTHPERPVYGRLRYMSYFACTRKFDVNKYINYYK